MLKAILCAHSLDSDAQLEQRIKSALDASMAARSRGDLHEAQERWNEFVYLIKSRSQKQIERMEIARGIKS